MIELHNIRIVLVEPSHPGNIGASARAMKNMGLAQLVLVNPVEFPSPTASKRAAGADDILAHALVYSDLDAALADCHVVFATSARSRYVSMPCVSPAAAAMEMAQLAEDTKFAILFGRERTGLTNDEIARAHRQIHIPTVREYSSLNLSQAVQVLAYEIYRTAISTRPDSASEAQESLASVAMVEGFYQQLQQSLLASEFARDDTITKLMYRLRRLYNRAQLEEREVNILRGILSSTTRHRS